MFFKTLRWRYSSVTVVAPQQLKEDERIGPRIFSEYSIVADTLWVVSVFASCALHETRLRSLLLRSPLFLRYFFVN